MHPFLYLLQLASIHGRWPQAPADRQLIEAQGCWGQQAAAQG
jgi:hypothetical protein